MTNERVSPEWPWPDSLDALIASPENHFLLIENDRVRVLETRIAPGQTTKVHTHRWPCVIYVLSWSDCVRRDDTGRVIWDSRQAPPWPTGAAIFGPALPPHTLQNVGTTDIRIINVELKEAPPAVRT